MLKCLAWLKEPLNKQFHTSKRERLLGNPSLSSRYTSDSVLSVLCMVVYMCMGVYVCMGVYIHLCGCVHLSVVRMRVRPRVQISVAPCQHRSTVHGHRSRSGWSGWFGRVWLVWLVRLVWLAWLVRLVQLVWLVQLVRLVQLV